MPYTINQRAALRAQLNALSIITTQYDQGVSPAANVAGELAAAVLASGVEQVETLDQARAALITALEAGLTAWAAAE